MLAKGILLSIAVLLCLFIFIVCSVIAVIKRNTKEVRNKSIIAAVIFLFLGIATSVYLSIKTFHVVIDQGAEVGNSFVDALGEHLSGRHFDTPFLDSIKGIQPNNAEIPNPYFYCAGFRDYYRMPLIYPYALVSIDDVKLGYLTDESGIKNIFNESNRRKSILGDITRLSFNSDYLLVEIDSEQDNKSEKYAVLNLKNEEIVKFESKELFDNFTDSINYTPFVPWISVKGYYYRF